MNRIDKVVVFHPLRSQQLEQILEIELGMVQQRVLETAKGRFLFRVTQPARDFLLREGTDLKYGARHLKRAIERNVVYPLASLLATEPGAAWRRDLDRLRRRRKRPDVPEGSRGSVGADGFAGTGASPPKLLPPFPTDASLPSRPPRRQRRLRKSSRRSPHSAPCQWKKHATRNNASPDSAAPSESCDGAALVSRASVT